MWDVGKTHGIKESRSKNWNSGDSKLLRRKMKLVGMIYLQLRNSDKKVNLKTRPCKGGWL